MTSLSAATLTSTFTLATCKARRNDSTYWNSSDIGIPGLFLQNWFLTCLHCFPTPMRHFPEAQCVDSKKTTAQRCGSAHEMDQIGSNLRGVQHVPTNGSHFFPHVFASFTFSSTFTLSVSHTVVAWHQRDCPGHLQGFFFGEKDFFWVDLHLGESPEMMNPIFFIRFIHFLHHFPWVSATIVPWSLRRWSPWWHQLWRPSAQRSPHGVSAHSLDLFLVVPCYMISWAKHIQMICFEHFNINNENIIILVLLLLLLLLFLISRLLFFAAFQINFTVTFHGFLVVTRTVFPLWPSRQARVSSPGWPPVMAWDDERDVTSHDSWDFSHQKWDFHGISTTQMVIWPMNNGNMKGRWTSTIMETGMGGHENLQWWG